MAAAGRRKNADTLTEAGNVKPQHAAGAGTAVEETGLLVAAHLAHRQILEALVGW